MGLGLGGQLALRRNQRRGAGSGLGGRPGLDRGGCLLGGLGGLGGGFGGGLELPWDRRGWRGGYRKLLHGFVVVLIFLNSRPLL